MNFRLKWLIAAFKFSVLRLLGYLFHTWINDLGVRVFTHFKDFKQFKSVLIQSIKARDEGKDYIVVDEAPKQPTKPVNTDKVAHIHNHKRKPKKKVKK